MSKPNFKYENDCWDQGCENVAGVDEVGRGCFAGPLVTGCVIFPHNSSFIIPDSIVVNDSKQMRPRQRERSDKWIQDNCLAWGVGEASVAQINRLGIKKATEIAFRKAIKNASIRVSSIEYLLVDAFYIPFVRGLRRKNQKAIIKGDTKSVSIAAASIVAKVYRDKLMGKLSREPKFRKYKWGKNKGYGTREHRNIIRKYGITRHHREAFVNTWRSKLT